MLPALKLPPAWQPPGCGRSYRCLPFLTFSQLCTHIHGCETSHIGVRIVYRLCMLPFGHLLSEPAALSVASAHRQSNPHTIHIGELLFLQVYPHSEALLGLLAAMELRRHQGARFRQLLNKLADRLHISSKLCTVQSAKVVCLQVHPHSEALLGLLAAMELCRHQGARFRHLLNKLADATMAF